MSSDGIEFDLSDLVELAADLSAVDQRAVSVTEPVMKRAGLNLKKTMVQSLTGASHALRHLPRSISYDVETHGSEISVEIGPDLNRGSQGALGGVAFMGTPTSAPIADINRGVPAEVRKTEKWLAKKLGDL